jgi:molybdate transport system permease protein
MANESDRTILFPRQRALQLTWKLGIAIAVIVLVILLGFPVASLIFRVPLRSLFEHLRTPMVLEALRLSVITSFISTLAVIAVGVPIAYLLATQRFRGKRLVEVVINLPMVLPPTVAGLGLLLAFGRFGPLGRVLSLMGITIPFTTLAVILAQMFVAAPFFINAARSGMESVEPRFLQVATTLRASPAYSFFRIVLPLSIPSLLAGAAMGWARALGEFGATITFAGNMPGRTQTMPLAVYMALQTDLESAVALAVILLAVSFGLLFLLRAVPFHTVK